MEKIMETVNSIIDVMAALILILAVIMMIAFASGYRLYIVMSGSMEPAISMGSVCVVDTGAEYNEIREGDIIAFRQSNGMVTHRVISITEAGMETKGDTNEKSDGITTTQQNFHGKTVLSIPYVGYVFHALQQPAAMWILGITAAAAILWELGEKEGIL